MREYLNMLSSRNTVIKTKTKRGELVDMEEVTERIYKKRIERGEILY